MLIYHQKDDLIIQLSELKKQNKSIGFVPTMGALHEGHLSLVEQALTENNVVVCSIFVNPTQFNESSDFENYPQTIDLDTQLLRDAGCDIVYIPSVEDVYENELKLAINLAGIEFKMEGAHRPGHFDGVVRVLKQLFLTIQPTKSYFGLKDFQQYLVVKALSKQANIGGEIIGCKTVREPSGLAKSSRNNRLTRLEKEQAAQIQKSFQSIKNSINSFEEAVIQEKTLAKFFSVEYLSICDGDSLEEITDFNSSKHIRVFFAGKIGNIRLIDNLRIK